MENQMRNTTGLGKLILQNYQSILRRHQMELPEGVGSILSEIVGSGQTLSDWLSDQIRRDKTSQGTGGMINTYPFGIPTNHIYPVFLGVCAGDTSLGDVFVRAKKYCEGAGKILSPDQRKIVVIITEKWDTSLFRRSFDMLFRYYALEHNVQFLFLLFTDYGLVDIPFLACNDSELTLLREQYYGVHWNVREAKKLLLQYREAKLTRYHEAEWLSPYTTYLFDFKRQICEIKGQWDISWREMRIPDEAISDFAIAVRPLRRLPDENEDTRIMNASPWCKAEVLGKRFNWHYADEAGLDPCFLRVSESFTQLINMLKPMPSIVDLHMHSTASDGTDTPAQLVKKVKAAGIRVFALTDHDTVEGVKMLTDKLPEDIAFIPGIEFSCRMSSGKCHILGYNCDIQHPAFLDVLAKGEELRKAKLEQRLIFLKERGIQLPEAELNALQQMPSVGKPHLANLMVKHGYAENIDDAIANIINLCHTGTSRIEAETAVKAILAAGGIPIWAHPLGGTGEKEVSRDQFNAMLMELLSYGLRGLECWYSEYLTERCEWLSYVARDHGLFISGGSDYHGKNKPIALGTLSAADEPVRADQITLLSALNAR